MNDNPTKWPNTFKQFVGKLPTNFLSVFGHFVNLALKGLKFEWQYLSTMSPNVPQCLLISYWLRLGSMSLKLFFLYPFYLEILYWRIIKFENKIFFFFFRLRETHNALQLSVFFSFFSSSFFCVIRNIEKFGAKNYFTDLRTTNTIYRFRDSVPVLEIHDCY